MCFPVLCKFWWQYGGVNGDLLQEGLCHAQEVCCTQSPCPCSSPLLTHTYAGDTQTWLLLNLCGVLRSWCAQGLFETSKGLWRVYGLILNAVLPLLSCWGFSFAFGHGVSFFGGIQHSVNGCSAARCNFGVLTLISCCLILRGRKIDFSLPGRSVEEFRSIFNSPQYS